MQLNKKLDLRQAELAREATREARCALTNKIYQINMTRAGSKRRCTPAQSICINARAGLFRLVS